MIGLTVTVYVAMPEHFNICGCVWIFPFYSILCFFWQVFYSLN